MGSFRYLSIGLRSSSFEGTPREAARQPDRQNLTLLRHKLLLDGSPLVHRVLHRPRFHPLRRRTVLPGTSTATRKRCASRRQRRTVGCGDPWRVQTWAIAVHPLHGLRYEKARKQWHLEPLIGR